MQMTTCWFLKDSETWDCQKLPNLFWDQSKFYIIHKYIKDELHTVLTLKTVAETERTLGAISLEPSMILRLLT